ncbi:MAG TPA: hypothetical protein VJ742_03730 [Nitrososphaera sp.]|nr:hypothetical protein [Nitrososphaera sp.]
MPGQGYPKDRVAQKGYEKGGVSSTTAPKPVSGKESTKTGRAGKSK